MRKYEWNLEQIKKAVKESINFTEVLEKIGVPRQGNNTTTLKNILNLNKIDYSHFTGRARSYKVNYVPVNEYLDNSKKIRSSKLKEKLLKEKLIKNECYICGINSWQNKPLTLQLHHIDGNSENNVLENLQLLCPNCHSQTDSYCGNKNKNLNVNFCKKCGKILKTKTAKYCPKCASQERSLKYETQRIELGFSKIPTKEQLFELIKCKSFSEIGRLYGVTDNSVRKWCKKYNIPYRKSDLK